MAGTTLHLDTKHEHNRLLVKTLGSRQRGALPYETPQSHPDPYMGLGSHPDVVARVWDELGASLPLDCRAIIYQTPALLHPSGVVLALCWGTSYCLRIPIPLIKEAEAAGHKKTHAWSDGKITDLEKELGIGWFWGKWDEVEKAWLRKIYDELV